MLGAFGAYSLRIVWIQILSTFLRSFVYLRPAAKRGPYALSKFSCALTLHWQRVSNPQSRNIFITKEQERDA